MDRLDPIDLRLLDGFQRDLPLVSRPFAAMGVKLGLEEAEVIDRLARMQVNGRISRVGGTVRPNTAGASTLGALAVSEDRIDEVAAIVGDEPGVNHSYLREADWNLWFVATAADATALNALLARIKERTRHATRCHADLTDAPCPPSVQGQSAGVSAAAQKATNMDPALRLLDLRLVRPFNIDLGFPLTGGPVAMASRRGVEVAVLCASDRPLLQALSEGLDLTPRPYAALALRLRRDELAVISRIAVLQAAGILTRLGVIVRHRSLGFTANAMVVWDTTETATLAAGQALAALPGVTLAYERRPVAGVWPYRLFCMIHARTRMQALEVLETARALPGLRGVDHRVLFSTRCFKQSGARLTEAA